MNILDLEHIQENAVTREQFKGNKMDSLSCKGEQHEIKKKRSTEEEGPLNFVNDYDNT